MSEITPESVVAEFFGAEGTHYDDSGNGWFHVIEPNGNVLAIAITPSDEDGFETDKPVHFRAVVVEGTEPPALLTATLAEIARERDEQNATMDGLTPPDGTGDEHYQEIAQDARRAAFEAFRDGEGTWVHIFAETTSRAFTESDPAKLRARLVKVAAETVCWIEALDRRIAAKASQAENGGMS